MFPGLKREFNERISAFLVFIVLWLDGSFYPLILLPFLYLFLYRRLGLNTIGFRRTRFRFSVLLVLVVGCAISILYYPIFVHYLSRRQWEGLSLITLLNDIVWYPLYEEIAYRGFFLGLWTDPDAGFSKSNLGFNLIQTFFFIAVHQNHVKEGLFLLLIPVSLLGFAMGLVFLRTRNISGCIVGHGLLNGVAHLFGVISTRA